uniref:Ima1 N-terminal domain-containing protein n=1 Tax=Spongospora subterranea TaxID=70186 RepID=A0A0H5RPP9_9EUKA|eukprot:CRZ10699.1 hypothetical protein [Spongospora subterranea]
MLSGPLIVALIAVGVCIIVGRVCYRRRALHCHFCCRFVGDVLPPTIASGSWYCPFDDCGQYNGFTESGDYDRHLPEQSDSCYNFRVHRPQFYRKTISTPVLCPQCQCQQALKIQAMSLAQSISESSEIEKQFPLCDPCRAAVCIRLKEISNRIRSFGTPLGISEVIEKEYGGHWDICRLLLCLLDIVTVIQALAGVEFSRQHLYLTHFEHTSVFSVLAEHECKLVIVKFIVSIFLMHKSFLYCAFSGTDLLIMVFLGHDVPFGAISRVIPSYYPLISTLRLFSLMVRVAAVLIAVLAPAPRSISQPPYRANCPSIPRSSPFDPSQMSIVDHDETRPQSHHNSNADLVRPSSLSISGLGYSLSALESSNGCDVEDLIAGISLNQSKTLSKPRISHQNVQPIGSRSLFGLPSLLSFVVITFVMNWYSSLRITRYLYLISLTLLMSFGPKYPRSIPLSAFLLLRQCDVSSIVANSIKSIAADHGLDVIGLVCVAAVFFIDWAHLRSLTRLLDGIR